jgi:cobalt-zinc-cadmium efflux system protein
VAVGHAHAHHHHHPAADADQRALALALVITATVMAAEVVVGLLASSLALLSDAAHNLTDAASIGLALVAARLALRPPTRGFTFGLKRAEVLSAQVNGAALLVLGAVIAYDAIGRIVDPPDVEGLPVVLMGALGAAANGAAGWVLSGAQRRSINVEGARRHIVTDLYASLAAVVAGVAVLAAGIDRADPVAALVIVAIMLRSGWGLVRDAGRVLLEGAPAGVDTLEVGRALSHLPGVVEVHDLHVWELTTDFPALAAHVLVAPGADCHHIRRDLQDMLRRRFAIEHTTLQVDHAPRGELLSIEAAQGESPSP